MIEETTPPRPRKWRKDIHLTPEAAKKLRRIWRARSLHEPGLTEDEIVNTAVLALPETPAEEWDGEVV